MTMIEEDPRNFEDLDAHGVQEALRDEMEAEEPPQMSDATETDKVEEVSSDDAKSDLEDASASLEVDEEAAERETGAGEDRLNSEQENAKQEDDSENPVWAANQMADHARMAEALLFAAVEPLDEKSIADRLPYGADIPAIMEILKAQYENRGITLSKISKKWRFVTAADVAHVLQKERVEQRKLSRAALETLAIIAYHQPCTRADIEDVRGVAVSRGSLDQLMEIGWVRLRGRRKDVPGRPVLYGTTQEFLEHFTLESLGDLPGMADLKAAGLLEARLPPDFQVPSPTDADEGEGDDEEGATEFAQDFLDEEGSDDAHGTDDDVDHESADVG